MTKNRVAKLVEVGKMEVFEEDIRKLEADELLVKIKATGICGSDLHFFRHGGLGSFKEKLPMHMGHEPSGIVVDSNKSKLFKTGDRVAIEPGCSCVECYWCREGKENLCSGGTFMGAGVQGAFADFVIVKNHQLVKMPDSMSFECGSLLEPIGVALHSMNLMDIKFNDTATIFGAGPIGLCLYLTLKKAGLSKIFLVDPLEYRCKFASELGAYGITYDSDYANFIKEMTGGKGTTLVFDGAGTDESIDGCLKVASTNSKMGIIGIPEVDYLRYNPHKMRTKEMKLYNVRRSNRTLQNCVDMYTDDVTIDRLVSHRFELENIQESFEMVSNYNNNVIKCMMIND